MDHVTPTLHFLAEESQSIANWCTAQQEGYASFEAACHIMPKLGANWQKTKTVFGFWTPELEELNIPPEDCFLEIWSPPADLDPTQPVQTVTFARTHLPVVRQGEYSWAVVEGLRAGTRHQVGDFYQMVYRGPDGHFQTILDPLAYSVPYGAYAPAELYDMETLQAERADKAYFKQVGKETDPDGTQRILGPTNLLQIHVNSATKEGTLASLTEMYQTLSQKLQAGEPLTPFEQNFSGYDGVQLMPIEPTLVYEAGPAFFTVEEADGDIFQVTLNRPDTTNWGYDILTVASPAPNPIVLGSNRPDELVDFIATLHNFRSAEGADPIKVVFDIVYGHADNQALPILNKHFFAGANMYGQNLNYGHPMVRAMLLEMQRRKSNYGVDGLRVDGAQDFKIWDVEGGRHDDDFLRLMNDVAQEVAGVHYRPWMIFEDGRPWPREDWELASTYREVTKQMPNVVQWGPLTFAHNTPFLFTFWLNKWWRIREVMEVGSHWITGCANHDTLRRGAQLPIESRVNTFLGETLIDIYKNGYDNGAINLFTYAFSPGIPMDFINATTRAPWTFIRNTDDRWIVKIMAEEPNFIDWAVSEADYQRPFAFTRLKGFGFRTRAVLNYYVRSLAGALEITKYDLPMMARILNAQEMPNTPEFTVSNLKAIARAWMDDLHEYCNVSHWVDYLDAERVAFNKQVRAFRLERPWLRGNLTDADQYGYLHPTDGTALFYGMRQGPTGEHILFMVNMEGRPITITPTQLPLTGVKERSWQRALVTPKTEAGEVTESFTLSNAEGVVYTSR